MAIDMEGGAMEGYWWSVEVNYETPEINPNQKPLDPRDRDWDWSKTTEKSEIVITAGLYDTTGYTFPGAAEMVNLDAGDAITNTAGDPPENGVTRTISRQIITLTKYVDDYSDLGATSWDDLEQYIDTVNSTSVDILDQTYEKWEVRVDSIDYAPHSENGFDVIKVVLRLTADKYITHIFSYPSAGYNEVLNGKRTEIRNSDTGEKIASPRLLDADGIGKGLPTEKPYITPATIVSVGVNRLRDLSNLTLPSTIP
jgi:hypothetical protein